MYSCSCAMCVVLASLGRNFVDLTSTRIFLLCSFTRIRLSIRPEIMKSFSICLKGSSSSRSSISGFFLLSKTFEISSCRLFPASNIFSVSLSICFGILYEKYVFLRHPPISLG